MRQLVFHRLAQQDIKKIRQYTIRNWGKNQAKKYLSGLSETIKLIRMNPQIGIQKYEIKQGAFVLHYKSHVIHYQFDNDKMVVVGVFHQSMLPKKHLQGRIL